MEIFTTFLLVIASLGFSILLVSKGIADCKRSFDRLKSGKS